MAGADKGYTQWYRMLQEDECKRILDATYEVLEHTGCLIKSDLVRELLRNKGCLVEGELVKIPPRLMQDAIATAPKHDELTIYDRTGMPAFTFDDDEAHFGPAITTVFLIDPQTGEKRHGTFKDAENTAILVDALPHIEWASTLAGIFDGRQELSDLYEVQALLKNTKKPLMYWASCMKHLELQFDMFEIAVGGAERLKEKPFTIALVCPIDPLIHTQEGLEQLIYLAKRKAPAVYIAGASLGSSSPITIAGSLVIGLADTLVGLLVSQLANPGAPFIASKFSDNVNMRNGSSYHSGPEFVTANMATADVFHYLGLPFCLNFGDSDSGVFDQVAAFDIAAQVQAAVQSSSAMNFASGALDNGNIADYSALVYCNEAVSYFKKLYAPFAVDDETLMVEEINQVGPGGNFLMEDATLDTYASFWSSNAFKPRSFDVWQKEGREEMRDILLAHAQSLIDAGPAFPLESSLAAEIDLLVEQAEKELL